MENLQSNCFEVKIPLHESENLHSKTLEKKCLLKFANEDDNAFKINACVDDKEFLLNLSMFDLLNMKEKNFTHKIHNFKLLLKAIKKGVKKNKVIVSQLNTSLKLTLFYTIVYDKEKISFELNPKLSEGNKKEEEKSNEIRNENYKAELIEYSEVMEDLGDRNIVKAVFENKGSCSWPKGKTSFACLPEFSSLLCQECILEDDVMPGEQIEIYLEFLKNEKQCLKKKYFTSLNLNVCQERLETLFLLDFNNPFKQENADENVDENEKDESEEITESWEDNDENKVSNITLKKEENKLNKEEVKKELKKEEKKIEDEKEKYKEDIKEKVEDREKPKEKEDVKKEEKEDIKKKENEIDLKDNEKGKKSKVQQMINEINKKEKERVEQEEEQKKEKGWKKLFHFHHKKK